MTEELDHVEDTKMIEDYKAVSSRLEVLRREAANFGARFKTLGYALINAQHSVALARGTHIVVSEVHDRIRPRIKVSDLDLNRLVELLKELEEATKEREMLFASLREMGAPVH